MVMRASPDDFRVRDTSTPPTQNGNTGSNIIQPTYPYNGSRELNPNLVLAALVIVAVVAIVAMVIYKKGDK